MEAGGGERKFAKILIDADPDGLLIEGIGDGNGLRFQLECGLRRGKNEHGDSPSERPKTEDLPRPCSKGTVGGVLVIGFSRFPAVSEADSHP